MTAWQSSPSSASPKAAAATWHGESDADELNPTCDNEPLSAPKKTFFRLKKHDLVRVLRLAKPRVFAAFCAIVVHCNREGVCWPSLRTICRLSGCRDRETVKLYVAKLVKIAAIERVMVHGKRGFHIVATDAPPTPFVTISRDWLEIYVASRKGLKPTAVAAHSVIIAVAGGRRTFRADLKELAAQANMSPDQFSRSVKQLADYGLIEHQADGRSTRWTRPPDVPQKSALSPVHEPQKSATEVEEVLEADKNNTRFKQDVRSAQNADAHPRPARPRCGGRLWLDARDRKANSAVVRCAGCNDCQPEITSTTSRETETFRSCVKPAEKPIKARYHSQARALPPLPTDAFLECWHIIETRTSPLRRDGGTLAKQRVNGVLKLAYAEGFVRKCFDHDLVYFDDALRREVESHVLARGRCITNERLFRLICDALREVLGYSDEDSMLGMMGPDADFPHCPRAVYAETHGGAM